MADPTRRQIAMMADGPAVPEGREPASVAGESIDVEQVAQQVFEAMRFSGATSPAPPKWVPGGNSLMQDHARDVARAILTRWGHQLAPLAEVGCPACEGVPKPGNQPCAVCGRPAPVPAEGEVAELALKELERTMVLLMPVTGKNKIKRFDTIRAALKRLHELENKADLSPAPPAPKPAEGEVGELVAWLRSLEDASVWFETGSPEAQRLARAAELLEQRHPEPVRLQQLETLAADAVSALRYIEQHHGRLYGVGWDRVFSEAAKLQPAPIPALPEDATVIEPSERTILVPHQVPVAERPWEREGWCDGQDRCWFGTPEFCFDDAIWTLHPPAERLSKQTVCLPAHALPLPSGEVQP